MEELKETIDEASRSAAEAYGDKVTSEFYDRLAEKRFCSTRCLDCDKAYFPPREYCPNCGSSNFEWFELPKKGTLEAFTTQRRAGGALRFSYPDVIGIVKLEEVGSILTRVKADLEELELGMKLKLDFVEVSEDLVLHQFKPA